MNKPIEINKGKKMSRKGVDMREIVECELERLPEIKLEKGKVLGSSADRLKEGEEKEWQKDAVPVKLDKIRAAVMNAKSAFEVEIEAKRLPVGDWLELVAKLSPKNVQIQAAFSFRQMVEELGPIDRDRYRFSGVDVIEAEVIK